MSRKLVVAIAAAIVGFATALVLGRSWGAESQSVTGNVNENASDPATAATEQGSLEKTLGEQGNAHRGSTEVWPTSALGSVTAKAEIRRASGQVLNLQAVAGEFGEIPVEPNEMLTIRLTMRNLQPNKPIYFQADWGGSLNRRIGALSFTPQSDAETFEFQYGLGSGSGRYKILVTQGHRCERLKLWAGWPLALGEPGPYRDFSPDKL